MEFMFSEEKNRLLLGTRGFAFDDVIEAIAEFGILADYEHPNQDKYRGQRIMVVRIEDYPHCVPYSIEGDSVELKTVYPSRKFRHLIEGDTDE